MNAKIASLVLTGTFLLTGCGLTGSADLTPTPLAPNSPGFISTGTSSLAPLPAVTATPVTQSVCTNPAVVALIDSLKTSMLTADGVLLSSLVSPNGMEVRYFRNGTAITYTPHQAGFLFETTFEANWGAEPGSGLDKTGSFHDVIVPDLVRIFNQPYTLHCNEIRHGGATYEVTWPYQKDFYSIHFAGTEQYGYLDWHTWAVGVEYDNNKPLLYALMNFFWEP
jgi:hypothetical protein